MACYSRGVGLLVGDGAEEREKRSSGGDAWREAEEGLGGLPVGLGWRKTAGVSGKRRTKTRV